MMNGDKIALVHVCDFGISTMYDHADWYVLRDNNVCAGDFVVVNGKFVEETHLYIGYVGAVSTISGEDDDIFSGYEVVSRIVASGKTYKKPMLISEHERRFEKP